MAAKKLDAVDSADLLVDLRIPPGNRLEALKGDRAGQHSIRINDQYRICFIWTETGPEDVRAERNPFVDELQAAREGLGACQHDRARLVIRHRCLAASLERRDKSEGHHMRNNDTPPASHRAAPTFSGVAQNDSG